MKERTKQKLTFAGMIAVSGTIFAYTKFFSALHKISDIKSGGKIKSEKDLHEIIEEESQKLGLDLSNVRVTYPHSATMAGKNPYEPNDYFVCFKEYVTRADVKHELYHVYSGDCDIESFRLLHYFIIAEPRATLYELFGIKL